ncbi:MAG: IclR family transcriptional regulator C-terminal domain-containing protein, partial [Proteobacteria bacterium]|nr:IclR family transcriptional regulator C-terminal domain-containing protein [Pseudomonadota bacterium]
EAMAALAGAELPRFTERSITDHGDFLREVERTRAQGYAVDDEEYLRGVRAVAAPVRYGGKAVAALWVAGFASRLTQEQLATAGALLVRAAETLSRGLATSPVAT